MPPVTISSWSPARIIWSAISTARIDDAQTLLIVSDPISIGSPAPIEACRAGAWPAPPSLPNGVRTAATITERFTSPRYQYALGVPTPRTTVKRHPERGVYDRDA